MEDIIIEEEEKDFSSPVTLKPRPYQLELLELARKENVIINLETGMGKTLIAILLIQHMKPVEPEKKAIFLCNQVALVIQQAAALKSNITDLKIGSYYGSIGGFASYLC
jgi:endoribonuclease Dicer